MPKKIKLLFISLDFLSNIDVLWFFIKHVKCMVIFRIFFSIFENIGMACLLLILCNPFFNVIAFRKADLGRNYTDLVFSWFITVTLSTSKESCFYFVSFPLCLLPYKKACFVHCKGKQWWTICISGHFMILKPVPLESCKFLGFYFENELSCRFPSTT